MGQIANGQMTNLNLSILIITWNVYGLKHKLESRAYHSKQKKQDSTMCCLQEMHFQYKDTNWIKVKIWKHIRITLIKRRMLSEQEGKEGYFQKGKEGYVKGICSSWDITILNAYVPKE